MNSIQILFKTKGVIVEKWIVGSSKIIEKTKGFSKISANCETHDDVLNTDFTEEGIFCKTCGVKLKLVPSWIIPA